MKRTGKKGRRRQEEKWGGRKWLDKKERDESRRIRCEEDRKEMKRKTEREVGLGRKKIVIQRGERTGREDV